MNGIVVLDKPRDITSFQAARIVGRLFGREKTGHAGTLDPMATGVLPVMVGRATKLLQFLPETGKEYEAEALFGIRTDTADADGVVLETGGRIPEEEELRDALRSFVGKSMQTPPMFSAIKQNGVPLYELARKGQTVDRQARKIEIASAELVSYGDGKARFRVACSAGTYIRTLAEDLAAKCGTICHLTALRRTAARGFSIESAVSPEELRNAAERGEIEGYLTSPDRLFSELPEVIVTGRFVKMFMNGLDFAQSRIGTDIPLQTRVRVYEGADMLGIAEVNGEGMLHKLWQSRTAE